MSESITEVINSLIFKWIENYTVEDINEINNGMCDMFADEVHKNFKGNASIIYTPDDKDLPGHAWICFEGRHYDSDSPEGVDDWQDLWIFKNYRSGNATVTVCKEY
jgi:hypothetical protein